ncbi:DUF7503 family protein [Halococcus saccharolyticus]|nr:hypothetical protein [Halococcus saccharolyticus]
MSEDNTDVRSQLKNHPKALSALFGLMILLSQAGSAAAGNMGVISGP